MHGARLTAFKRIISAFTAAVVFIYAFSILMYNRSVNLNKLQTEESMAAMEENYIERLTVNIIQVKDMITNCMLKQDWSLLLTKRGIINNYETLQLVLYGQERLKAIKSSSLYALDVRAHLASWGRTISAEYGPLEFKEEEFDNVRMPFDASGAQFVYYKDNIYLTSVYKYKQPVRLSIVLEIDLKKLAQSLEQFNITDQSTTMLFSGNTGQLIAMTGKSISAVPAFKIAEMRAAGSGSYSFVAEGIKYICVFSYSDYLGFAIAGIVPASALYRPLKVYYVLFWVFSAVVLIMIAAYIFYSYKIVGKPMTLLVSAFKRVEKGDFSVRMEYDSKDDFAYLYGSFDRMVKNIQHLVDEVYKKEILVQKASLKQLQSQINPHFFYNSFYILHRMIKVGDVENAETFAAYLGKYFKYVARSSADIVPLSMELEHARTYAEIMALRLGNRIRVRFADLPEKHADLEVPWMILQPLLENSFEHGFRDLPGDGKITVSFREEGDDLFIVVEDNGKGMSGTELAGLGKQLEDQEYDDEITALINIHRRISIMFGEGYGLTVASGEFEGTRVCLRLRKKEGEKL